TGLLALAAMMPGAPLEGSGTLAQNVPPIPPQGAVTPFTGSQVAPAAPPPLVRPQEPIAQPIAPRDPAPAASWGASSAVARPPMIASDPLHAPSVAAGGVLAASDLAAASDRRPDPGPEDEPTPQPASEPRAKAAPPEGVKLIWFEPAELPRIRKHAGWRSILI